MSVLYWTQVWKGNIGEGGRMLRFSWTLGLVEYDRLVERLDAFDDLSLIAHPNGLKISRNI